MKCYDDCTFNKNNTCTKLGKCLKDISYDNKIEVQVNNYWRGHLKDFREKYAKK
ncbi:MAG: hypothetical protein ACFFDF_03915 [Candidatus Odinarchaeota archaeon]